MTDQGGRPDGNPPKKKAAATDPVELFNLKDDPYEKTNLVAKQPEGEGTPGPAHRVREAGGRAKARPKPKDFVSPKVWGE